MKANVVTSILFGLIIPWAYFLFVSVSSLNVYENGVLIKEQSENNSGIRNFIEFHGTFESLVIYAKTATVCFLIIFVDNNFKLIVARFSLHNVT